MQCIIYFFLLTFFCAFVIFLKILVYVSELNDCSKSRDIGDKFDYIIVGGGSAGAILASRLAEDLNLSVLLIEAGGAGFDILDIPVTGPLKQLTPFDWQYATVPQKHSCLGLENNISKWPSGKILGGSTHLNYMIYLKGYEIDYLNWKDPDSNHWSFNDINYYFEKGVKLINSSSDAIDDQIKKGKFLVNVNLSFETEFSEIILKAAAELGYKVNDINIKNQTGFMKPHVNIDNLGKRWTSDKVIKFNKKRNNLKIFRNALATRILLKNNYEAYGVEYERCGEVKTAFARYEIVVSAGAVGSPKLLMLSGIGPKEVLSEAKVPLKVDLPVGKNLQDHVTTGLDLIILKNTLFSFFDLILPTSAYQYFIHGSGPFTSNLVEAVGVIHSSLADPRKESPDLEFMVMMAGLSSDKGSFLRNSMGISKKVWDDYFAVLTKEAVVSIIPVLLHPKSTGEVTLDPTNPRNMPKINPRYLSRDEDVRTLVRGLRIVRKMTETSAFKNFGAKFNLNKFPGCEFLEFDSDEYWECYVRHLTLTVYHPVGTCKMGGLKDGGVVDHRLRVHKTNKLRVVDASIMPTMPSANTVAAVVMIAEKGADLIKEDFYNRLSSCRSREILRNEDWEKTSVLHQLWVEHTILQIDVEML